MSHIGIFVLVLIRILFVGRLCICLFFIDSHRLIRNLGLELRNLGAFELDNLEGIVFLSAHCVSNLENLKGIMCLSVHCVSNLENLEGIVHLSQSIAS